MAASWLHPVCLLVLAEVCVDNSVCRSRPSRTAMETCTCCCTPRVSWRNQHVDGASLNSRSTSVTIPGPLQAAPSDAEWLRRASVGCRLLAALSTAPHACRPGRQVAGQRLQVGLLLPGHKRPRLPRPARRHRCAWLWHWRPEKSCFVKPPAAPGSIWARTMRMHTRMRG